METPGSRPVSSKDPRPLRRALIALLSVAASVGCGGASAQREPLLPPPPGEDAPPEDATSSEPAAARVALEGAWWDLAAQARQVPADERHAWEERIRGLDEEARADVLEALEEIAQVEPTTAGIRAAGGLASGRGLAGPAGTVFRTGAVYVLSGLIARAGEEIPAAAEPSVAGAALLRVVRDLNPPAIEGADGAPLSADEVRARLLLEARGAMGASIAAQAEVQAQRGRRR